MKITCNKIITVGLENSTILNSTNVSSTTIDTVMPIGCIADEALAKEFAKLFNYTDGIRVINFYSGFHSLRQCLGDSFNWAFGLVASADLKLRIGRDVSDRLKEFLGGKNNGVRVMQRTCSHGLYHLENVSSGHHAIADCYGRSLVVPTGERSRSRNFAEQPIYMRLDVEEPTDDRSLLNLKRILLCAEDGSSICGLAAVTDYIENLPDANSVFTTALGAWYDVLRVNAQLFETWAWHTDNGTDNKFCVDLGVRDIEERQVAVCFTASEGAKRLAWHLALELDGSQIPFGQLSQRMVLQCDVCAVVSQWTLVRNTLCGMTPDEIKAAIDYEHCFGDHLERFGDDFGETICENPTDAITQFQDEVIAAVERFRKCPTSWPVALFHGGNERALVQAGDESASKLQLFVPLYLTQTDKDNLTPTVYLCTGVNINSEGAASVSFPSVLEAADAEMDNRFFRRMLRQSLGSGVYHAKEEGNWNA